MKRITFLPLAAALLMSVGVAAQTTRTVNLTAAGTLGSVSGIASVQNLTLTGSIDARDVKYMRDSMPSLSELDLSGASVVAYSGVDGTSSSTSSTSYPANEMPQYSFYNSRTQAGKTSLTSVKLPVGLTFIGSYAFYNCTYLALATIPSAVISIGISTFAGCNRLITADVPNSVTTIGDYAFSNCNRLPSFTIPANLRVIGNYVFQYCYALTSITIPNGVTSIGQYAFYNCSNLSFVNIPASVGHIGDQAFSGLAYGRITFIIEDGTNPLTLHTYHQLYIYGYTGIDSLYLGRTLQIWYDGGNKAIPSNGVFDYNLKELTIGSAVTTLGNCALFVRCSGLETVNVLWGTPPAVNSIVFGECISTAVLQVPEGKVSAYKSANVWKNFGAIKEVSDQTPVGCLSGTSGSCRWQLCLADSSLAISGNGAMADYDYMMSIWYGKGNRITTLTISDGVTSIGDNAFHNFGRLTSITIPNSVTSIGEWAFVYSGLTSVAIPNSVTSIGSNAFYYCSSLASVAMPDNITSISDDAFAGCRSLTSITIPNSVTSIGRGAFSYSGLTSVAIPNSVTSIGSNAFYYCSSLASVAMPNSVTSIGREAFSSCSGLTSVTNMSLTPQSISSDVFGGTMDIKDISLAVPISSVTLYRNANVWKNFKSITGGIALSVKANYDALGSVSGTLSGLHPVNTVVSLTATSDSGYSFLNWTSGSTILGTSATLSFTLTEDTVVTANFGKTGIYNIAAAGALKDVSGVETLTHLTLTGSIDARDVKFMRDNMPFLTELDLSGATLVAYEGTGGTSSDTVSVAYPANEMPQYSFSIYNRFTYTCTGKISLTSVKLPVGLTSIGNYAFYGCSGLSGNLTLPVGLTSIGERAFYSCSGLSDNLTLPASLTSIGERAFYSCSGFTSVTNLSLSPQNIRDKNVFYNVGSNAVLQVPMISLAAYIVADGWKDFYSIIGGSTLTVTVNNSAWGSVTGTTGGWQPANSAVTLTAIPAQGYAFESWTSGGMILGTSASFTFTLIQDIPIVANFKPYVVYVVVAFDTRGGSAVASQEVASGSSVAKPANPTRSGYTFAGWYKDDALTDAWNFASAVTANVTLYAKWNAGSATGVESAALGAAKAYPNPTTGAVTIEGEGAEVLLYSLSGELLKRTRGSVVDLSGYPSGIYLLKAGGKTARVVKQ